MTLADWRETDPLRFRYDGEWQAQVRLAVAAARYEWARYGAADAVEYAAVRGWVVREQRFDAGVGGVQALLIPRSAGGFTIVVDPDPTPSQEADGLTGVEVRAFRVAHEYAHTIFYDVRVPSRGPKRSGAATKSEELFCDEFARQVTGVLSSSVASHDASVYGGWFSHPVA